MNRKLIRNMVFSAIFAALIAVFIAFLPKIPTVNGYIHFGDSIIYIAACLLPRPFAIATAAIGGGLADSFGYAIYIIPTAIIKPLNALCFSNKGDRILTTRNAIALFPSTVVTIVGYAITEAILFGSFSAAIATLGGNLVQGLGSMSIFIIFASFLDKSGFKKRFFID